MAFNKSYATSKQKLETLWNELKIQETTDLKSLNFDTLTSTSIKQVFSVTLFPKQEVTFTSRTFTYELPNFPSWAISMCHIVPIFSAPTGIDYGEDNSSNSSFNQRCAVNWKELAENHYLLTIQVQISNLTYNQLLELKLIICNENNYFLNQSIGQ